MANLLDMIVLPQIWSSKAELFDFWQHFKDDEMEDKFRSSSFEECRKKVTTLFGFVTIFLVIAWVFSLANYINGNIDPWALGLRTIILAFFVTGFFYCQWRFWRPWYVYVALWLFNYMLLIN